MRTNNFSTGQCKLFDESFLTQRNHKSGAVPAARHAPFAFSIFLTSIRSDNMVFADLITHFRPLIVWFLCFLSVQDIQFLLIWMEIASHYHHYKQNCYQCNISLLVMQPDAGASRWDGATVGKSKQKVSKDVPRENHCCWFLNNKKKIIAG